MYSVHLLLPPYTHKTAIIQLPAMLELVLAENPNFKEKSFRDHFSAIVVGGDLLFDGGDGGVADGLLGREGVLSEVEFVCDQEEEAPGTRWRCATCCLVDGVGVP